MTVDARSAESAVNTIYPPDGDPLLAQSNRLAYLFLNENPTCDMVDTRWVCRASGIAMSPSDTGDADTSTTHVTFYDPWQYMMGLPCFADQEGTPIPQIGLTFASVKGNVIAYTLLQNTLLSLAALDIQLGFYADIPNAYSGTTYWDGTNEDTPELDFVVQQGTSLGQALQNLASTGNDVEGTAQCIDIIFEPIWDPVNRPGFTSQISVYNLAGVVQPTAPMAWGRFTYTAVTAERDHDGTPGSFVNVAQFVPGQGGALDHVPPVQLAASVMKYNSSWLQQFFPSQPFVTVTNNLAIQILQLQGQGKRTFAVDPDPLRAALPFRDYNIGDRIPVFSTDSQRLAASGYQRVQTIPFQVNADGVTMVSKLLTSPDWPEATGT